MQYFIGILLVLSSLHHGGDNIYFQWYSSILAFGVLFILHGYRRFGTFKSFYFVLSLYFYYILCNAAYVAEFRSNRYAGNPTEIKTFISYSSLAYVFYVLLFFTVLSFLDHRKVIKAIGYWGLVNTAYVLYGFVTGSGLLKWGQGYSGFIHYSSVNSCLIAATIPLFPKLNLTDLSYVFETVGLRRLSTFLRSMDSVYVRHVPHALGTVAVFLGKSSIPLGTIFVVFFTLAMFKFINKANWKKVVPCLVITGVTFTLACSTLDRHLFDSGYRFQAYRLFFNNWYDRANMFTGFGPGIHKALAPEVQYFNNFMVGVVSEGHAVSSNFWWLQLHSDWLEHLIELGVVGVFFLLLAFVIMSVIFIRTNNIRPLASFWGLSATALFNFPIKYFPGAFILGALTYTATKLEEQWKKEKAFEKRFGFRPTRSESSSYLQD